MKMTTEIPSNITTPDSVETRLGTLKFFDGFPDDKKVMDNLDFSRGVQTFLSGLPGSSLVGMRTGLHQLGANNNTVVIFEELLDSKALWLTANTDSIYFSTWLDLHDGPLVMETPPNVPGKGWNVLLRLYGPLEPWYEKTWRPGEIELVK
jgi:hypothetical protein